MAVPRFRLQTRVRAAAPVTAPATAPVRPAHLPRCAPRAAAPGGPRAPRRTRPAAGTTHPARPRRSRSPCEAPPTAPTDPLPTRRPRISHFRRPLAHRKEAGPPFPRRLRGPALAGGESQGRCPSSRRTQGSGGGCRTGGLDRKGACVGPLGLAADSWSFGRPSPNWDSAPAPVLYTWLRRPCASPLPTFQSAAEEGTPGPSPCREVAEGRRGPHVTALAPPPSARLECACAGSPGAAAARSAPLGLVSAGGRVRAV